MVVVVVVAVVVVVVVVELVLFLRGGGGGGGLFVPQSEGVSTMRQVERSAVAPLAVRRQLACYSCAPELSDASLWASKQDPSYRRQSQANRISWGLLQQCSHDEVRGSEQIVSSYPPRGEGPSRVRAPHGNPTDTADAFQWPVRSRLALSGSPQE